MSGPDDDSPVVIRDALIAILSGIALWVAVTGLIYYSSLGLGFGTGTALTAAVATGTPTSLTAIPGIYVALQKDVIWSE
jgi:hypothetical protein